MNLNKLFPLQKQLDEHILKEKGLHGQDLLDKKAVAILTELGEVLNELQVWKFWKENNSPRKEKMLEEYVDNIHFIISIAIDHGVTEHEYTQPIEHIDINKLVLAIANMISRLPHGQKIEELLNYYIFFGYKLGFTEQQVIDAYLEKNKINHRRQQNGY